MVHFARIATFDNKAHFGALAFANQVVVHRTGEQQRRYRRIHRVAVAITQHNDACTIVDEVAHLVANVFNRSAQAVRAVANAIQTVHHHAAQVRHGAVVINVDDLGEFVVVNNRKRQRQLATIVGAGRQQVGFGAEG